LRQYGIGLGLECRQLLKPGGGESFFALPQPVFAALQAILGPGRIAEPIFLGFQLDRLAGQPQRLFGIAQFPGSGQEQPGQMDRRRLFHRAAGAGPGGASTIDRIGARPSEGRGNDSPVTSRNLLHAGAAVRGSFPSRGSFS
jgi:hypothetical protein